MAARETLIYIQFPNSSILCRLHGSWYSFRYVYLQFLTLIYIFNSILFTFMIVSQDGIQPMAAMSE